MGMTNIKLKKKYNNAKSLPACHSAIAPTKNEAVLSQADC
jgi:hypothetical protein